MSETQRPSPVWLTRDTMPDGNLSSQVIVWYERPQMSMGATGGAWWSRPDRRTACIVEVITIKECREKYGTAPDTDRECIRVGGGRE